MAMSKKTLSIDFEDNAVIIDKSVKFNIGQIKQVVFDRENQIGKVIIEDSIEFIISLKSAYSLILILGTNSWVDLP